MKIFYFVVYLSDICKAGDHLIVFHAQEMPTLPAAPYPCKSNVYLCLLFRRFYKVTGNGFYSQLLCACLRLSCNSK